MILVDTNVWVRSMQPKHTDYAEAMRDLVRRDLVAAHDFVHGELMLGRSGNTRQEVVKAYARLRFIDTIAHKGVVDFIRKHKLENRGIGYVDAHLLAAAHVHDVKLWTLEKALSQAADDLGVAYVMERS